MQAQELLQLLHAYAVRSKSADVDLRAFIASLLPGQADTGDIVTGVQELSERGKLTLSASPEGPRTVSFPDFPLIALTERYRQLSVDASLPFPREETAPVPVPDAEVTAFDVKSQLDQLLDPAASEAKGVAKILFPENIPPLLVPRPCVGTLLIDAAVLKVSAHLHDAKNAAYVESKLSVALRGNELLMRQALEDVTNRPRKAAAGVTAPSDFSFRFWTQLCSVILLDVGAKTKLTETDQDTCQSVHVLTYAAFHGKATMQREQERAADRKALEHRVRRLPFLFSEQDLLDLTDEKGASYVVKHGRDFIRAFVAEKSHKAEDEPLPFLVRVRHKEDTEYVITRDMIVPVFLAKLAEAAESLRPSYVESWTAQLKKDVTPRETKSDAFFRMDVELRVRGQFPHLAALANGDILFLAGESPGLAEETRRELARCFAVESILRPFPELLGLSRQDLLKAARAHLPFWQTIPFLNGIVRLLRRLLTPGAVRRKQGAASGPGQRVGERRGAPSGAGPQAASPYSAAEAKSPAEARSSARARAELRALLAQYVTAGKTPEETLKELAEKWNPLYEPEQKLNLVDDVNALVRDIVRPVRRALLAKPMDQGRVRALARQICENRTLQQIRKREPLQRYVELYVIRTLQAGL